MYCSSKNYGKGCNYGPKNTHVHTDDPTKCIYCGSKNYGKGCKLNPHNSSLHVHGAEYNQILPENVTHAALNSIFLTLLHTPTVQYDAFKAGIISESGEKLRDPKGLLEHSYYTPMIRTTLRIKRFLGSKLQLLEPGILREHKEVDVSPERIALKERYRICIEECLQSLTMSLQEGMSEGLTFEEFESIINEHGQGASKD